jgi:hypothetical protein
MLNDIIITTSMAIAIHYEQLIFRVYFNSTTSNTRFLYIQKFEL